MFGNEISVLLRLYSIVNTLNELQQTGYESKDQMKVYLQSLADHADEMIEVIDASIAGDKDGAAEPSAPSDVITTDGIDIPCACGFTDEQCDSVFTCNEAIQKFGDVAQASNTQEEIFGSGPVLVETQNIPQQITLELKPDAPRYPECSCQHCTGLPRPIHVPGIDGPYKPAPTGIIEVTKK